MIKIASGREKFNCLVARSYLSDEPVLIEVDEHVKDAFVEMYCCDAGFSSRELKEISEPGLYRLECEFYWCDGDGWEIDPDFSVTILDIEKVEANLHMPCAKRIVGFK